MKLFQSIISIVLLASFPAVAELKLPSIFSDHMVMQRNKKVTVWGQAKASATIQVSFAGKQVSTKANKQGQWSVQLAPMKASKTARELIIKSSNGSTKTIKDVLVGEVWLASGQSNMEWSPRQSQKSDQDIVNSTTLPNLRLFAIPRKASYEAQTELKASWKLNSPKEAINFSAVAWFFAKKLHEELDVPIGIIRAAWGGSKIEPWTTDKGFQSVKELDSFYKGRLKHVLGTKEYKKGQEDYLKAVKKWQKSAQAALAKGVEVPSIPSQPKRFQLGRLTYGLYQAMIHPIVPYTLRGFIWYQGESNNGEGMLYKSKKKALINGWRRAFKNSKAPFYFVQIAPYNYGRRGNLPELQFAQQQCLDIPYTGMAVTNDIGNTRDIHPRNKSEVGRRLSLWALAKTYKQKGVAFSGPLYKSHEISNNKIIVSFKYAKGLKTKDGQKPSHFEVADASGKWFPADAVIKNDKIELSSAKVKNPTQARFAWNQLAEPNLCNAVDLPAGCFHTHWPKK